MFSSERPGFTVVELLIVIVVVGILAAISIVAYSGISNSAHDTAIRSDLSNFAKKIELYRAENGVVPLANTTSLRALGLKVSEQSYNTTDLTISSGRYNLLYCRQVDGSGFAVIAWSKSGTELSYANGQISESSLGFGSRSIVCPALGIPYHGDHSVWIFSNNWII